MLYKGVQHATVEDIKRAIAGCLLETCGQCCSCLFVASGVVATRCFVRLSDIFCMISVSFWRPLWGSSGVTSDVPFGNPFGTAGVEIGTKN